MPARSYIHTLDLSHPLQLGTLVENRRVYTLNDCELNIFETFEQSFQVPLMFNDFVITSMMRGKKVMHFSGRPSFDYLPGETLVVPAKEIMLIDFPEADIDNPVQCMSLAVDAQYVNNTVNYLNTYYNCNKDEPANWKLEFSQYHFSNDNEISELINKIIRISTSSEESSKDIFVDLSLKELLIRLIQTQRLIRTVAEAEWDDTQSRFHFVLNHIHTHLTQKIAVDTLCRKAYLSRNLFFKWFKQQSGLSPLEYINNERVKLAKDLLGDPRNTIQAAAMYSGFNDVNYFIRVFKKVEGITPKTYQNSMFMHAVR